MTQTRKEWLVNGALAVAIALVIVLIGGQSFAPLPDEPPVRLADRRPPIGDTEFSETTYTRSRLFESPTDNLARRNVFRALVTRSPSPTPKPPTPTPTPDLSKAVGEWKYSYPVRRTNTFVFADKNGKEIQIPAGKPFIVEEGRQKFEITVEPSGRYDVIIRYGDQMVKKSIRD
ncbi:hypothetical protein JW916_15365 [Candidatus Sumerlaeota bacterium]|nr:hypothetical protein [Candidatus Sumerlaeota bacterium]